MASLITLRRSDGTSFGVGSASDEQLLLPLTSKEQVMGLLDGTGKIALNLMSDAVLGGAKLVDGLSGNNENAADIFGKILENAVELGIMVKAGVDQATAHEDLKQALSGRYFQVQNTNGTKISFSPLSNATAKTKKAYTDFYSNNNFPFSYQFEFDGDDGASGDNELENGDFLVFNGLEFEKPNIKSSLLNVKLFDGNEEIANEGNTSVTLYFNRLEYVNTSTRIIRYGAVSIVASGTDGFPNALLSLEIENETIPIGVFVEPKEIAGQQGWEINHTIYDVEIDLSHLSQSEWNAIYSMTGTANQVIVHFGVINNTYALASESQSGIIRRATEAEATAGTDNTVAMTPLRVKAVATAIANTRVNAIPDASGTAKGLMSSSLWTKLNALPHRGELNTYLDEKVDKTLTIAGIDLNNNISVASLTNALRTATVDNKGVVELGTTEEAISQGTLDSSRVPSLSVAQDMIKYWGGITRFNSLAEANASPEAKVNGKVIIIG